MKRRTAASGAAPADLPPIPPAPPHSVSSEVPAAVSAPRTTQDINEANDYFWRQVHARVEIERKETTEAFIDSRKRTSAKGVKAKQDKRADRDRWVCEQSAAGKARKQIARDLLNNKNFPRPLRKLSVWQIGRIIGKEKCA